MNYKKIYENLCSLCQTTSAKERIFNRNLNDERLNGDYIYTETHHIIPKHAGGTNDNANLVEMLPEEHYMAHLLRFKAYNDRNDFLAIRFMVNGYTNKIYLNDKISVKLKNKLVSSFKQNISMFRKQNTWQTKEGIKKISEARKGTIVVVDVITNEMIGSVDTNHPSVISGKWVHHSTGKLSVICKKTGNKKYITTKEYNTNKKKYAANVGDVKGIKNPRYSGFTDEELLNIVIHFSMYVNMGVIFSYNWIASYYRQFEKYKNLPKAFSKFRFDGKNKSELHRQAAEITGFKINQYFFNKPSRKKEYEQKIKNYKIIC